MGIVISSMMSRIIFYIPVALVVAACTFTQKVRTGLQAYEVKQYSLATQLFQQEYAASTTTQDKARLAYMAGESFSKINDPVNASSWYHQAYKDGLGPDALEKYAMAMKIQERYDDAIQAYEELSQASPGNASYRAAVTVCRQAKEWKANPLPQYTIASAAFNTPAAEYAAQPIAIGKILFTSDRPSRHNSESYLWTGRSYSDMYVWNKLTNTVEEFSEKLNSAENDGTAVISPDGNMLIFTRCYVDRSYDAWCKLMISYRRSGQWSPPSPFPFTLDKVNYGHPAFAANGATLFFSSDLPGGHGGHDLYYSLMDSQGLWSDPVNLGSQVNTVGDELYPTVYLDTLFFSSDHHAGLGGLDIFKTWLDQQGNWVPPQNLRSPINSGGDDFGFVVDTFAPKEESIALKGYFTSTRLGSSGQDDIYTFQVKKPEKGVTVDPGDVTDVQPVPSANYQVYLSLKVFEPVYEVKDDPNSRKMGNKPLPNGPVIVTEGLTDRRLLSDNLGQLLVKLEWNQDYVFTARYRDHLASSVNVTTKNIPKDPKKPITTINEMLILEPIFKDKEIVLENIFYDYDEWFIRDDAKPSLNHLSAVLKTNPAIRIQLSSHTDCRGTDEYNMELSQKRAQAAIDYLKSTGIPERRLEAVGYGESVPAVLCECESCTEAQHQINRRTTFKIID